MTTAQELQGEAKQVQRRLAKLSENVEAFNSQVLDHVMEVERKLEQASYPGLHHACLLGTLCGPVSASEVEWVPNDLLLLGSGPWAKETLAAFLRDREFGISSAFDVDVTIVLGAHGWSTADLDRIKEYATDLRIYTQELFVLGLVQGADPFTLVDDPQIEAIAYAHPFIQSLLQQGMEWPIAPGWGTQPLANSEEVFDYSSYESYEWRSRSVLSDLGYSARENGAGEAARREALARALTEDLSEVAAAGDLERWGAPKTVKRLAALVAFMLWLNRFQSADKPAARAIRLKDLRWLQARYDPTRNNFAWPELTEKGRVQSRKRTPNAHFMKALTPSAALAAVIGNAPMPRTEIVSKLWLYIKKHKLQDSVNKRIVNADDKLFALFGKRQVSMFEMAGLIGKHVR